MTTTTHSRPRDAWAWEDRVPDGQVTVLTGRPGVGKTMLAVTIAAAASRTPGDGPAALYISHHPGDAKFAVMWLNAADGRPDRVHFTELNWLRPAGAGTIRAFVEQHRPRLVVLDDYEKATRGDVRHLRRLAEETGAAVLCVTRDVGRVADEADSTLTMAHHSESGPYGDERIVTVTKTAHTAPPPLMLTVVPVPDPPGPQRAVIPARLVTTGGAL